MNLEQYKQEIEFMAWDKKNKRFIETFYNTIKTIPITKDTEGLYEFKFDDVSEYNVDVKSYSKNDIEILPYTNCKDSQGNKLYLFDVCVFADTKGIIIFCNNDSVYKLSCDDTILYLHKPYCKTLKRIGSIYELPEIQNQFNIEV